jgi:hypothetical protein
MDNKLQLNFEVEPSISFGYSTSESKIESINRVSVYVDLKLGKKSAGHCYVDFKELISEHTRMNKKSSFDRELTIKLYEKIISELNQEIESLKK